MELVRIPDCTQASFHAEARGRGGRAQSFQAFLTADFADGRRFPSRRFSIPGGPRSPEAGWIMKHRLPRPPAIFNRRFRRWRRFPSRRFSIPGGPRSPEAVSRTNPGRMRFVPKADSGDLVPPGKKGGFNPAAEQLRIRQNRMRQQVFRVSGTAAGAFIRCLVAHLRHPRNLRLKGLDAW